MNVSGQNDAYRSIRRRIHGGLQSFLGGASKMADAVFIIPDGLYLVYRWVTERAVSFNQRALFVLMIFYLVTPFDLLPEVVFGPLGLLDDIPLTVVAFDLLLNRQQSRLVERLWPGDPSVLRRIQQVVKRLNGWVGRGLWKKIKNRFQ